MPTSKFALFGLHRPLIYCLIPISLSHFCTSSLDRLRRQSLCPTIFTIGKRYGQSVSFHCLFLCRCAVSLEVFPQRRLPAYNNVPARCVIPFAPLVISKSSTFASHCCLPCVPPVRSDVSSCVTTCFQPRPPLLTGSVCHRYISSEYTSLPSFVAVQWITSLSSFAMLSYR